MKRMIYFLLGILALWVILQIAKPFMPDWARIILNSKPENLKEAIEVAKETYDYDHRS